MTDLTLTPQILADYWKVLLVYLIPFGGGIPAGVLLAKNKGIEWQMMMFLYFISDVMLAIVFEPLMILFIRLGKKYHKLARISEEMKLMIQKTIAHYGSSSNIFVLIMIAFGVDPMTGRAVAVAMGHGFVAGWIIAIAGDMIYFSLLMVSTLWLNNIIGDGTWTMLIILAFMFIVPVVFRKIQNRFQ